MKKLVVTNFVLTIVAICFTIFGEILWDLYMSAPLGSESEALYLSLGDISTVISGLSILVIFVINTIVFFKRDDHIV